MAEADRLPLPRDDELDDRTLELLKQLPPLNIAKMLARTGMAPEFYGCVRVIFDDAWFPEIDREIMLFRICRQNRSEYEIHQHAAYGGFDRAMIDAIMFDDMKGLDPWQRELCRMSDEISAKAKLSPQSVAKLVEHYGDANMASRAIMVMAWFNMLSRFVDSTGVPIEEGTDPYKGIAGPASGTEDG